MCHQVLLVDNDIASAVPYIWEHPICGGGGGGGHALYPEVPCGAESMVQSCIENKKTNEV